MKIVVISDTHVPKRSKRLPRRLLKELKTADQIIHAGDWQSVAVYEQIKAYAPLHGVYGNVDGKDLKAILPKKQLLRLNGWTIGVTHGHGDRKTTEKRVVEAFQEEKPDVVIFGHSHIPYLKTVNQMIIFNPGSPTDKRRSPYFSFGILRLGKEIHAEHVFFK